MKKLGHELSIPTLIPLQTISDDRELFVLFTDYLDKELINRNYIVEDYGKGVIRGLHYQIKEFKKFTIVSRAGKFITLKLPLEMAKRNDLEEIRTYAQKYPAHINSFVMSSRHHGY